MEYGEQIAKYFLRPTQLNFIEISKIAIKQNGGLKSEILRQTK